MALKSEEGSTPRSVTLPALGEVKSKPQLTVKTVSTKVSSKGNGDQVEKSLKPISQAKKKRKRKAVGICTSNCRYDSIRRAAKYMGFVEAEESADWSIFWTDTSVSLDRCMAMKKYQRINHFPGMLEITRKDLLSRNLIRLRKQFPKEYSIFPMTWVLPADQGDLLAFMRGKRRSPYFICKPESGCQGRGIFLTKRPAKAVKSNDRYIVQQYISRPLLIDGFKFDLRIYALVTACDPLRIYVFHEGLARFATMPYADPGNVNMDQPCMHLTNYSINKHSKDFIRDEESGHKRKFSSINKHLEDNGYNVQKMWDEIDDVIIKTLIAGHPVLQHNYRTCFPSHTHHSACFEILGFDILVDRKMKCWLLEVNHSPSFHTDSKMDKEIKDQLLIDTMRMLRVRASDKQSVINEDRKIAKQRLTQMHSKSEGKTPKMSSTDVLKEKLTASADEIKLWESKHLGGFRRVYPMEEGAKDPYERFFEKTGSLYQTTASTKAREEAVRLQRLKLEEKIKSAKQNDSGETTKKKPPVAPRIRHRLPRNTLHRTISAQNNQRLAKEAKSEESCSIAHEENSISIEDELERLSELKKREELIRGLGVIEMVYDTLHCTPGTVALSQIADDESIYDLSTKTSETKRACVDNACPFYRKQRETQTKEESKLMVNLKGSTVVRQQSFPFIASNCRELISLPVFSKTSLLEKTTWTSPLTIRPCSRPASKRISLMH